MKKLLSVLLAFCLILLPACSSGSSKPDQTATAGDLTFTVPGEYRINEYDIITEVTTKKFTKEVLLFNVLHKQEDSLEAANGTIQNSLESYRNGGYEISECEIAGVAGYRADKEGEFPVYFFVDENTNTRYIMYFANDPPQELIDKITETIKINK